MTVDSQTLRIRFVGCSRKMKLSLHSRQSKFADQVDIAAKGADPKLRISHLSGKAGKILGFYLSKGLVFKL
jgi:hypothetical protein